MKMKNRLPALAAIVVALLLMLLSTVNAYDTGGFIVTGGASQNDYSYADGVLTILTSKPLTISTSGQTNNRIFVTKDVDANLTFSGVNISCSEISQRPTNHIPFQIADDSQGDVTITLAAGAENYLLNGGLIKNGSDDTVGTLTIQGGGKLTATGKDNSAGIGGASGSDTRNIEIKGTVTINATGYNVGAGIGGGENGSAYDITISGGTVTATGLNASAGIGGGMKGGAERITISGGTVSATGKGGGAGIGGGLGIGGVGGSANAVTISSGAVSATGNGGGAGIGGGENGSGTNIAISGGNVTAAATGGGAAIGGGQWENPAGEAPSSVSLTGGDITATANPREGYAWIVGASIGGGYQSAASHSNTLDGDVRVTANKKFVGTMTKGVVLQGNQAAVYGSPTLVADTIFPSGGRVQITKGQTLTVPDAVTLTNAGDIYCGGTIAGAGQVNNTGNCYLISPGTSSIAESNWTGNAPIFLSLSISGGEEDVDYSVELDTSDNSSLVITIKTSTPLVLMAQTTPISKILIADGVAADLTLDGVIVDASAKANAPAIDARKAGAVTLRLAGSNTIKGGSGAAGIATANNEAKPLTITSASGNGSLDGSLTVSGGYEAAGIGGGNGTGGSYITIAGGTVTANGGHDGAGIGGGNSGSGEHITISGGKVTANAVVAGMESGGAGIGGGSNSGSGSYITISGGEVTATGAAAGAGIGGGYNGGGSNITISDGVVNATGTTTQHWWNGSGGAGIGGGPNKDGTNITISGGTVIANGGKNAAGIGGGSDGKGTNITIENGDVTASAGHDGAGIGGGNSGSGEHITISGGKVTANAVVAGMESGGAGIGGGSNGGNGSYITISGGEVTATGAAAGAGIGGGYNGGGSNITISDGVVYASASNSANGYVGGGAGIGGGGGNAWTSGGKGSDILISGGSVTATGGTGGMGGGAGVGGGYGGNCGNISIAGGQITATGGTGSWGAGAGIGGGGSSRHAGGENAGDKISISGGVITATAGENGAAGIGGGGHDGEIFAELSISGSFITATGSYKHGEIGDGSANAIGGGAGRDSADLSNVTGTVIIDGAAKTGEIYGDSFTLTQDASLPEGVTLFIDSGKTFTGKDGVKLAMRNSDGGSVSLDFRGGSITDCDIVNGDTVTLPAEVTLDGYVFGGWFDNEACDGTPVTKATNTGDDNKIYYAKWISPEKEIQSYYKPKAEAKEKAPVVSDFDRYLDIYLQQSLSNPFGDLADGDWFYDDVMFAFDSGYMTGVSDMTFAPYSHMTRAMAATILWRADGSPIARNSSGFSDVEDSQWYSDAVAWAKDSGIVNGYSDGRFGPDDEVTRQQLAAILYRYAQYKGMDVSVGENTNILSYTDAFDIDEYAIPALQWAIGAGVMQGSGDSITPKAFATRAEFAAMLKRAVWG